jgi:hypothetical protein
MDKSKGWCYVCCRPVGKCEHTSFIKKGKGK